jgi:aquaporin Z
MGGLVAGLTLTLVHLVTIPVDNTSVNPARSLATALFADTDPNALGQVWAFIIFPLIGSAVGVLLYRFINDTTAD